MKSDFRKHQREVSVSKTVRGIDVQKLVREISIAKTPFYTTINTNVIEPEYAAILSYASSQGWSLPSAAVQQLGNALVYQMKMDGTWSEFDVLYIPVTDGDNNFARINWKSPGSNQLPAGGTFEKFKGIDSGTLVTISPTFTKFQLTGASIFGDYQIAPSGDYFPLIGWSSATRTSVRVPRQAPPRFDVEFFDNTATQYTIFPLSQTQVFFQLQRNSTTKKIFEFGSLAGTTSTAASALPTNPCTVLGAQAGATCRFFGLASELAGAESAMYNAWSAYMSGIIPLRAQWLYDNIVAFANSQGYSLPSASMQIAGKSLIQELIVSDAWDQMDCCFVLKTNGDANFAKINWKKLTLGAMASGGGAFTSMDGINLSTTLNYNYTPSAAGNKWSLNEASFFSDGYDKRAAGSAVSGGIVNNAVAQNVTANWFDSSPSLYVQFAINDGSLKNGIIGSDFATATDWFTHVQRFYSGSSSVIRDGTTRSANFATASVAVPTVSLTSLDANRVQRFFGAGSSLSGKESALVTAWNNYKSAT